MANVTELRVALTVEDFDQALAFYRDVLGLEQLADWSSGTGRVIALDAGRATLELFDRAQAESVDAIEAGRRVSGAVRFAVRVADSQDMAARLVAAAAINGHTSRRLPELLLGLAIPAVIVIYMLKFSTSYPERVTQEPAAAHAGR